MVFHECALRRVKNEQAFAGIGRSTIGPSDEDGIMGWRRAIEAVDSEPDPAWPKRLVEKPPGSILVRQDQVIRLEAEIPHPEWHRTGRRGDLDDDRFVHAEAEIACCQGAPLVRTRVISGWRRRERRGR